MPGRSESSSECTAESGLVDTIAAAIERPGDYVLPGPTDGPPEMWSRWQARAVVEALDRFGWPEVL